VPGHASGRRQGLVNHTSATRHPYGQSTTLEAVTAPGSSGPDAAELSDNGDGTWSLTMNGDKSLTATFTPEQYTLTIQDGGTV
jgi:hypothetical protein